MYAILVLQHHLNPKYVLDEMEMYEVKALMKYAYYSHKDSWEQSRMITYMTAQVNSKNRLQMTDVMEFPWEKEEDEEDKKPITKEQLQQLREQAENYIKAKQQ